jgi:hypothetical protein
LRDFHYRLAPRTCRVVEQTAAIPGQRGERILPLGILMEILDEKVRSKTSPVLLMFTQVSILVGTDNILKAKHGMASLYPTRRRASIPARLGQSLGLLRPNPRCNSLDSFIRNFAEWG